MSQFPIPDWAAQVDDAQFTDPALLQTRARKFERTIKRRNFIEYAAGALCLVAFGSMSVAGIAEGQPVFAAASSLCMVCVLIVLWQLNKRGSYEPLRPEDSCRNHLREQYERQYKALRSVPVWYLGPLAVGVFGFHGAMLVQFATIGGWTKALEGTWQTIAFTAAFFAFVWWLNWFAARKLKEQIDQIDALTIDAL